MNRGEGLLGHNIRGLRSGLEVGGIFGRDDWTMLAGAAETEK